MSTRVEGTEAPTPEPASTALDAFYETGVWLNNRHIYVDLDVGATLRDALESCRTEADANRYVTFEALDGSTVTARLGCIAPLVLSTAAQRAVRHANLRAVRDEVPGWDDDV